MSVLYDRLKSVEQGKKPEMSPVEGEEFPIDGEIKRQKEERRRRTKFGIMVGMVVFILAFSVGLGVISIKKKGLFSSNKRKQPPKPKLQPAPPPLSAPVQKVVGQMKPQVEELVAVQVEPVALPVNLFEQGTELYKQNRYKAAAAAYMEGLQQDTQQAVGYNNLGVVYYKQKKFKKAATQLRLAVKLNPQYAEAHYNLAIVLEKRRQNQQALFHYLKFLEFAPTEQQDLQEKVQAHVYYYY